MVNSGKKETHLSWYIAVFAIALLLRAYAIDFGYFNPDERINDAARVLAGELVPTQHFYPPLNNYLIAVSLVVLFAVGLATDMWASVDGFRQAYFDDPTPFYLAGRYLTAALSALIAPLSFDIARRNGLTNLKALAVSVVVSFLPVAVMMGHVAKGDSALAAMCVATLWVCIRRWQTGPETRSDIMIGVAVALALSFKQSAIFFAGPMALAMVFVLGRSEGLSHTLKSLGIIILVSASLMPILNIGIFLDLDGFFAFQDVQTVMSIKEEDGFAVGIPITFEIFGSVLLGLNPVFLGIAAMSPIWLASRGCGLTARKVLLAGWSANAVGTVVISLLVGERQPDHLFLVQLNIFTIIAVLVLMDMLSRFYGFARIVLAGIALLGFGISFAGSIEVLRQAAYPPLSADVIDYLSEEHGDRQIKTTLVLPIPKTRAAQQLEHDRLIRLATKYETEQPSFQSERLITEDADNALFYSMIPFAMYGLEDDATLDEDYTVTLHTWPLQPQEWTIEHWLDKGFEIFVVDNLTALQTESRSSFIRDFFQNIEERCALLRTFEAKKPIFLEYDVIIFDCSSV